MGVVNLGILIERIKNSLTKSGYVKNTDYAGSDVAGVIKYNNTTGTTVNSSGVLTGITRTEAQYNSGGNGTIICKGTLENIIAGMVQREIVKALGGTDADASGTTLTAWKATKGDDGWTISSTKS